MDFGILTPNISSPLLGEFLADLNDFFPYRHPIVPCFRFFDPKDIGLDRP
jgi:hypothetical protein